MKKINLSPDCLFKIRDGLTQVLDAITEELEANDPNTKTSQTKIEYEKIQWTSANGNKGPFEAYPAYQQKPDEMNQDYMALKAKLLKSGSFQHNGLFYWLFPNGTTIGRKPTKQ
jgi:hypothetical protein